MEQKQTCALCNSQASHLIQFSCGHTSCSACTSRILFQGYLMQLIYEEIIQIQCTCKLGSIELAVPVIHDILSAPTAKEKRECTKHKEIASWYCKQCKKWLCAKCLHNHDELFTDHTLTEEQPEECGICTKHKNENKEIYCKDCQEEICKLCIFNGADHYCHNYQPIEEYATKLRNSFTLQHKTFEEFTAHLSLIAQMFTHQFNSTMNANIAVFDDLIKLIGEHKLKYIEKMKVTFNKTDQVISIIRTCYYNFYRDCQKKVNSRDLKFLQYLNSAKRELLDMKLDVKHDITKIKGKIEKIIHKIKVPKIEIQWKDRQFNLSSSLTGHDGSVYSLLQLRDEQLASGSWDNTIKIWETKEFKCTQILYGHTNYICTVIQLKDGRLASGSADNSIKIWELFEKSYKWTTTLTGHTNWVNSLIQLKDGRMASGSGDKTIKIWQIGPFKCLQTLIGHKDWVNSLFQLKDSQIASGSGDNTIRIWDIIEMKCTHILTGHTDTVRSLLQLKDGRIISGSSDKTIKIWDMDDFKCSCTVSAHNSTVRYLIELKDGKVASASWDNTVKIWDCTRGEFKCIYTLSAHKNYVISIAELGDGRLATGAADNTIKIWD